MTKPALAALRHQLKHAAMLPLLLICSGCVWAGPALYGEDQAETPVPPGRYVATVENDPTAALISAAGKATVISIDGQLPSKVLLIPMADERRKLWIIQAPTGPDGQKFAFGLLERTATGWLAAPYIVCADTEAIVREAGGTIERQPPPQSAGDAGPDTPACVFRTRSTLEAALRRWLVTHRPEASLIPTG